MRETIPRTTNLLLLYGITSVIKLCCNCPELPQYSPLKKFYFGRLSVNSVYNITYYIKFCNLKLNKNRPQ